jgi:hypothetical protein
MAFLWCWSQMKELMVKSVIEAETGLLEREAVLVV